MITRFYGDSRRPTFHCGQQQEGINKRLYKAAPPFEKEGLIRRGGVKNSVERYGVKKLNGRRL